MATGGLGFDPGGGGGVTGHVAQHTLTYADRLKTNVNFDQRLERNVLEIKLEKTEKEAEIVDQECVARLLKSIGLDILTQVEGYLCHHFSLLLLSAPQVSVFQCPCSSWTPVHCVSALFRLLG